SEYAGRRLRFWLDHSFKCLPGRTTPRNLERQLLVPTTENRR
ncbi:unnamed protein product, partial [Mycena citricolor]